MGIAEFLSAWLVGLKRVLTLGSLMIAMVVFALNPPLTLALLDASAVLQVIWTFEEENALKVFDDSNVLDLTKYEVGNGIRREYALQHAIREEEFHTFL